MDTKIILDQYDLERLPMQWFVVDLPKIERELKETIDDPFSNSRLMLDYTYRHFSLQVHQERGAPNSANYHRYKEMPGFAFVGDPDPTIPSHVRFNIRPMNVWSVYVWDCTGATSLFTKVFVANPSGSMPSLVRSAMLAACKEYTQGYIHCSACGVKMPVEGSSKRSYFAGRYCEECWESKYRAIEARESYE